MDTGTRTLDPPDVLVQRLCDATNAHDLDAVVACFASDYRNVTPSHPERGFVGAEQVRRNWQQIFAAVPDIAADVVAWTVDGDTVWSEWEHRGTRRDGSQHLMRGVVVFVVRDGQAASARFYLEPVDTGPGGVDEAVRRQVVPGPST
jgi:ketosteroid isomerase-like protein